MQKKINFLLFLSLFLLINICVVSASDVNMTDESPVLSLDEGNSEISQDISEEAPDILEDNDKTDPVITTNNNVRTTQDSFQVTLKDNDSNAISGERIIVNIVGRNYTIKTDSNGVANLRIGVAAKDYPVTLFYNGNDDYNSLTKSITLTVLRADAKLTYLSNNVITSNYLSAYLKDFNGNPISGAVVSFNIVGKTYNAKTDSNGLAKFRIGLAAKNYSVKLFFNGNNYYNSTSNSFTLTVSKADVKLTYLSDTVIKSNYFKAYLKDSKGNPISGECLAFTVSGKTYHAKTDSNGLAKLKIGLAIKTYPFKVSYAGNKFYKAAAKDLTLIVPYTTSISIGNSKLLTNGFLRIYLKSDYKTAITNKDVVIEANNAKFTKKTSSEGFISFKPSLSAGKYTISVKFAGTRYIMGSSSSKTVDCVKGDPLNPFESKIPLVNGVPNIDYMIGGYVWADENGQYTLTKDQYKSVIQRDSYCLYLNGALSKYTFFKSKDEPNYQHIVKREKWNVIEREINTKIVKANKYNYWPDSVTVNLKGKQYSYSEVRDEQNTGYTCGPTSASICSQALRNYYNEAYLSNLAGTTYEDGSSTSGLKKALDQNNMQCTYFYKSSWNTALSELSKGNCALIFHTWYHYVAIIDISADGKKVLVVNPSGDYDHGSHSIPTNWVSTNYMYNQFNDYDTSSLIVKLKYSLSASTKNTVNNFYSSMGTNWNRHNVNERVPQIGK